MPDNTIRLYNVPGSNIIFRNFRGKPKQFTREGDRSFCLIIPNRLFRDQLAARGCNIKKLKDKDIEFVNVAVRVTPSENVDDIWTILDVGEFDKAFLEFTFYEYNINGKTGTRIYLKNARFYINGFDTEREVIDIRWPGNVTYEKVDNTNKTEETNMEKMTRAEVMGQLQMGITAFEMEERNKRDPIISKLMLAMRNAIEYIGEVPKCGTKTVTVEKRVPVLPVIKQVIFNDPATIVVWYDDTKTVVKCQEGDTFDKEKGLAMAICKRLYGNESNFNNLIKNWTEPKMKKAEHQAQAEANKTAKGKSKGKKGRSSPAVVNTNKMVVITEAYVECVRKKMAKRGFNCDSLGASVGLGKSTVNRYFSPNVKSQKPKRMKIGNFKKINKALGIRWKIED